MLLLVPQQPEKPVILRRAVCAPLEAKQRFVPRLRHDEALQNLLSGLCVHLIIYEERRLGCVRVARRPRCSQVYLYTFYLEAKLSWQELLAGVCPRLPGSLGATHTLLTYLQLWTTEKTEQETPLSLSASKHF